MFDPKSDQLPKYANPPVVETILGVQFDPLPGFRTVHLGAFWTSLGSDWQNASDAAPLNPVFEKFDEGASWGELGHQLSLSSKLPPPRVQLRNSANDRMIQVQSGRFIVNWLGTQGAAYPSYETIRLDFRNYLGKFSGYLESAGLQLPLANQWEITYLNHIPQGTVWKTPVDWSFFRPLAPRGCELSQAKFETLSGEWHFAIPNARGRLHVTWQHGKRQDDVELVVLNLTARGPCKSASLNEDLILDGLDVGRDCIVRSFSELMSADANQYWGLESA